MRVIERFKVVDDDGTINEINKWELAPINAGNPEENGPSLESLPIYRTASGNAISTAASERAW